MAINYAKQVAVYLLLSHPLSALKKKADALTPRQSAVDAVSDLNGLLKYALDPAEDYTPLIQAKSTIIVRDDATSTYKVSADPKVLAALVDYTAGTDCPDDGQIVDIYNALGHYGVRPHA